MLEKLRTDWRRGRALKFIRLGQDSTFEYKTPAGPVILVGRFDADDDTLVLTVREIYAKDVLGPRGPYKADAGLASVRGFAEWVAEMASDLGYTKLRVGGKRTKGRRGYQSFEFPVDKYLRSQRPRR